MIGNWGKISLVAAIVGVGMVGQSAVSAASGAPPPTFTCKGTAASPGNVPAGTYSGLVMPAGSVCRIAGPGKVNDQSPLSLSTGSGLEVTGGGLTVQGPITVGRGAVFAADFMNTEDAPVTVIGGVTVQRTGVLYLGTEIPHGPIFATIQGRVQGQQPSALVIQNTYIAGSASVYGGGEVNALLETLTHNAPDTNYIDFEDDQVKGDVSDVGYGGVWGGVLRTTMRGNFAFAFNREKTVDEYDIGSDVINGSAYCQGNNPPPNMGHSAGSPSIVHGATFGPQAKTCTGISGGTSGPPGAPPVPH